MTDRARHSYKGKKGGQARRGNAGANKQASSNAKQIYKKFMQAAESNRERGSYTSGNGNRTVSVRHKQGSQTNTTSGSSSNTRKPTSTADRMKQFSTGGSRRQMTFDARKVQRDSVRSQTSIIKGAVESGVGGTMKGFGSFIENSGATGKSGSINHKLGGSSNTRRGDRTRPGQRQPKRQDNRNTIKQIQEERKKAGENMANKGDKLITKGTKRIEEEKKNMSGVGKWLTDLEVAGIQFGGDALVGAATGGIGTLPSMYIRAAGTGMHTAEQMGADRQSAFRYGLATAGLEVATEKMFGLAKPLEKIYGKGVGDLLMTKVLGKLAKNTGKTGAVKQSFMAAFGEGLEEMVAEGVDPVIANKIYADALAEDKRDEAYRQAIQSGATEAEAKEYADKVYNSIHQSTSVADILRAGSIGAAMGGLLGGGASVIEASNGARIKQQFGKDGLRDIANRAANVDDKVAAVRAQEVHNRLKEGMDISDIQANMVVQAVQEQEAKDQKTQRRYNEAIGVEMRRNGYESPIVTDDNGNPVAYAPATNDKVQAIRSEAKERLNTVRKKTDTKMTEEESNEVADAYAAVMTGVATSSQVGMFTTSHPEARALFETMNPDIKLPKSNEQTREFLFGLSARNYVETAKQETEYRQDVIRGYLEEDMTIDYGTRGQEEFSKLMEDENIDPRTAAKGDAAGVFEDYYRAGAMGIPFEHILQNGNPVHNLLTYAQKKAAYESGFADMSIRNAIPKGSIISMGQRVAETKTEAHRGKLIDSEHLLTGKQRRMYQALAEKLNININIVSREDVNGFYKDGEVYLSTNNDGRGLALVFGHEITHHIKAVSPENYEKLEKLVRERWEERGGIDEAIKEKQKQYKEKANQDLTEDEALEEIIADATYEMFGDVEFVKKICASDKTFAQSILYAIRRVLADIRECLANGRGFTPSQNEALLSHLDILSEFEDLWLQGLRDVAREEAVVNEEGVIRLSAKKQKQPSIRDQLLDNADLLSKMKPVANVTHDSMKGMDKVGRVKTIMDEYDKHFKGGLERPGFGRIELNRGHVSASMRFLNTDEEYLAFFALPSVLKKGKVIESHDKHKGTQSDSVTFAAPIILNGAIRNMGAAVKKTGKNKYYTHRVVMPDGSEFIFNNKKQNLQITGMNETSRGQSIGSASKGNVPQADLEVKDEKYMAAVNSGDMKTAQSLVDEAAREAGYYNEYQPKVYHGTNDEFTVFNGNKNITEENGISKIKGYFSDQYEYSSDYGNIVNEFYIKPDNYLDIPSVESVEEMRDYLERNGVTDVHFNDFITDESSVEDWIDDYETLNPWLFFTEKGGNITERIQDAGYNGLTWDEGYITEDGGAAYMPFESSAVKLADPVVYDDNGNVIPLSERFNQENADIRYSVRDNEKRNAGGKLTRAEFNRTYYAHKLNLRGKSLEQQIEEIKTNGFKGSGGFNIMPADINDNGDTDVATSKYGGREGDTVLLVPKEYVKNDSVVNGYKPEDYEIVTVERDFQPYYELYSKAYDEAKTRFSVKDVEDNIRDIEGKDAPIGVSVNNDGNIRYSMPTEYNNHLKGDGRIASVRALRDDWMKDRPRERKALNNVLDQVSDFMVGANDLYEYVSLDNVQNAKVAYRKDENGNPLSVILSCQVANGEYEVNFDFTTICKKRESFQKVIEDLYKEGVDELDLTEDNIFAINQELKKYGYETACPICFVEARRYMNKEYARKIVETWNEAVDKINPNADYFDFENADIESFDYPAIDKAFKSANIGSESFEEKVAKLVSSGEVFQKKLKQSDVLTNKGVQGLKAMSNKKNSLFGYLKQSRGASAPKEAVAFVAYNGEFETLPETMKKMPLADYLASIAGARLQSFSDFQIENTFDYMQLIAGMSARRIPTHTYSKEPSFARIFGMTGMKINMSIVCDIDPNVPEEYAGMTYDDSGNLVYNFGEQSFPMDEAVALQADKRYSKNVGTILVGLSNYHIEKALDDKDIRFIIPYHSSGLPSQIMDQTKLEMAKDYTKFQNTCTLSDSGIKALKKAGYETDIAKVFKEKGRKGALKYYLDAFEKIGLKDSYVKKSAAGYGEFDLYGDINDTKNPRRTADNYIEWCLENGNFPLFFQFAGHKNYYKVLYDFDPYDSVTERYAPQKAVQNVYPGMDITKGQTDTTELESIITEYLEERNEIGKQRSDKYSDVMTEIKANIFGLKSENVDEESTAGQARGARRNSVREDQPPVPTPPPTEDEVIDQANLDDEFSEWAYDSSPYAQEGKAVRVKSEAELRKQVEQLRLDKRLTHGRLLDTKPIKKDIEDLLRTMATITQEAGNPVVGFEGKMSKQNQRIVDDTVKNAKRVYKMMKQGRDNDAVALAMTCADDIVSRIQIIDDANYDVYKKIKGYLKSTPMRISEENSHDIPDFNDFKKDNFGKVRIVKEGGVPVEAAYAELCEMFPGMFDEEITHPAEMLMEIVDARGRFEPYDVMLTAEEREQLLKDTTADLLDIIAEGQPYRTWADKKSEQYQNKVNMLRERYKEAQRDLRNKERARADRLVQAEREKGERRLAQEKERSAKKVQELKDKSKEQKAKQKDNKQRKEFWKRIQANHKTLSDWLVKPTDDKHIPENYKLAVAELLMALDMQTERSKELEAKTGHVAQKTFKFQQLLDAYEEIFQDKGAGLFEYDDEMVQMLKTSLIKHLEGKSVDALDTKTMGEIDILLKAIVGNVRNANKAFAAEKETTISEMAEKVRDDCKKVVDRSGTFNDRKRTIGRWLFETNKLLNISMKKPREFFEHLGGGMTDAYMEIRHGMDKHFDNMDELRTEFGKIFSDYNNKKKPGSAIEKWRDTSLMKSFDLESGETITLNPAQIMSLYCLNKREQAHKHMYEGAGIIASRVQGVSGKVVKLKNDVEGTQVAVTRADVDKIIATLSEEQIKMADQLQGLLNGMVQQWGNKTSMKMFNYEKFTEKDYFPIKSDDAYVASNFEEKGKQAERIRNFGFTKGTDVNASNPIVIADIFEVVADHCNKMSLYNALAAPLSDFQRMYNTNFWFEDEQGSKRSSVQNELRVAFGTDVDNYISNLMADINNNTQVRPEETAALINKSLANYKKATIGLNLRVAVQQPTAIVRAFDIISPKYFVGMDKAHLIRNAKEMIEHCPIARWKSWGHNEVDMARDIDDIMMNRAWSRFDLITMGTYGALDIGTWGMIWSAVKKEVKATHPDVEVGSDEFWNLCNERASEVFDKTQVVDSVLHRSQVMRDQQIMVKLLTSFMAEPTTTFNMLQSDLVEARDLWAEGRKKEAMAKANRVIVVFTANAAAVSAAAAFIDWLRDKQPDDDDDDKEGWALWYANFLSNFVDNANVLMMIPFVKDVLQLKEGWGTSNMAFEGWESLMKSISEWEKFINGKSKKSNGELIRMTAEGIGLVTGIPVKSVLKDFFAFTDRFGISFASTQGTEEKIRIETEDGGILEVYPQKETITDKFFKLIGIKDNSDSDKFLNKFGLNLSEEEKKEKAMNDKIREISEKVEGLEGEERDKKLWETITRKKGDDEPGLTQYLEAGNTDAAEEMLKLFKECGGSEEYFNEKMMKIAKSSYKKTIGEHEKLIEQTKLYDYMLEHGMSEADISKIARDSDTRKEFQKAYALGEEEKAILLLSNLINAGLTYEDYEWSCKNAYRTVNPSDYATGEFSWPTNGTITSGFGHRASPGGIGSTYHQAIDIGAPTGTPVNAADGGKVIYCGWYGGYGNRVVVDHGNGYKTCYSHLSGYQVKQGQVLRKGQQLGKVGSTGKSTGPHLDFQVEQNGQYVDPSKYLPK